MQIDLEPGDLVINPLNKEWGVGQVQSVIKSNTGKQVINSEIVSLKKIRKNERD